MSSDVKLFEKEEFGKVRVVMQGENPWFVASDVAKALGYEKPNNAVNEHCKKMNKITLDPNLGGRVATVSTPPIQAIIIPESDVYRLVMRSNLPKAVEFQDWICEEVIPSIRKTGAYVASNGLVAPQDFPSALRALADEYEAKQRALAVVEHQKEVIEAQEIALGDNRDWKAVTAIPWLKEYFVSTNVNVCRRIGMVLGMMSRVHGIEIRKAENDRWGSVNVYHISIIEMFKNRLDTDGTILVDIRKRFPMNGSDLS